MSLKVAHKRAQSSTTRLPPPPIRVTLLPVNAPRCPICRARLSCGLGSPLFPFCSQQCKLVDLARWIDGDYVIAEPLIADGDAAGVDYTEDENRE